MIHCRFRAQPGLADEAGSRLTLVIKRAAAEELGLDSPDAVEVEYGTFGPMDDVNGLDWILDVAAHGNANRIANCDGLAQNIARDVRRLLGDDELGIVRLHLAPMGVHYTHGPLGVGSRNFANQIQAELGTIS